MPSKSGLRHFVFGGLSLCWAGFSIACGGGGTEAPPVPVVDPPPITDGFTWAGHTWKVTQGAMVAGNTGSLSNVFVDASGYLHLKIAQNGSAWTCAELFTTDDLGFGTYQWQVEGALDKLDKNVVLGLFPYGPARGIGKDGQNEIDIEFARWGNAAWDNGNWTVYPASASGTQGSATFMFTQSGPTTTSRFTWSSSSIVYSFLAGLQPANSNTNLIHSWTYAPSNPTQNIPQQALPLGMNLWLFKGMAPSDGKAVEIIIRSFTKG